MGRPTKQEHERRTASLPPVRVTAAEMVFVQVQAEAAGLSVSDYVRQRALGAPVAPRRAVNADRLLVELNRAGVNLNQIARHLNAGGAASAELAHVLDRLYGVLEKVGRAHGA